MKSKFLVLLALLLASVMLFSSCDLLEKIMGIESPDEAQPEPDSPVAEEPNEDENPDEPTQGDEEPIPHEHIWNEGKETKVPTCIEEGEKTFTCLLCGEAKTEILEKNDHAWDEGVETTPASLTEEGVKTFTCTVCGETKTEVIPIIGSNMSDGTGGGGGGGAVIPSGGGGSSTPSNPGNPESELGGDTLEPDMQNGSALGDNLLEPDMK